MRGVYSHITPGMRAGLKAGLQELRGSSLYERSRLAPRSAVPVLDALLAPYRGVQPKIGSRFAPRTGIPWTGGMAVTAANRSDLHFIGVSDGIRTHDIQDHNLAL
jgi:hypothetical protein